MTSKSRRRLDVNVEEFKRILSRGHLYRSLYHFTDRTNLPSIAIQGILSKLQIRERGIAGAVYGGNEWSRNADALKKLEGYVNLCFTRSHPMCHIAHSDGRILNPEYLPIDPEILKFDGVKITLDVANKAGTELLDVEDGLEKLDKKVLYTHTDWEDAQIQERLQKVEKYEILVPTVVPTHLIRRKF